MVAASILLAICNVTSGIPSEGGSVSGATAGASALDASCATTGNAPEDIWQWFAPRSGVVTVETCSTATTVDSVVTVNEGNCNGPVVGCNDDTDGCPNDQRSYRGSRVSWQAVAGQDYSIIVDGYDTTQPSGAYTLTLTVAGPCEPDPGYTATPVLTWDIPTETVDGFRLYWRHPGEDWDSARSWTEPCWHFVNGNIACRGADFGSPVQRFVDLQGEPLEFAMKAYVGGLESEAFSNVVTACMPPLWHVGEEPYP